MFKRKRTITTTTTRVSPSSQSRYLKRTNVNRTTRESIRGRNILFNCHSRYHGPERVSKEIKVLSSDKLHFNEKYKPHPNDYRIDVSRSHENIRDKFGKTFDVIYLVNCPSDVYIEMYDDDMGNWSPVLFQNLDSILNEDGIIVTRLAETAMEAMLNTYNATNRTNYSFSGFNEDDDISHTKLDSINLKIKRKFLRETIPILRKMTRDFLKFNNLGLKLLSRADNEHYVHKNFSNRTEDSIHEFFVIKKIANQTPNYSSPNSITPMSLRSNMSLSKSKSSSSKTSTRSLSSTSKTPSIGGKISKSKQIKQQLKMMKHKKAQRGLRKK